MPTQSGASARLWIPRRATALLAAVAVALTALAGAAADAVATASAAFADANAGSIRIVSDRETSAVYAATRIADADALPLDGVCAPDRNFAWEGVAGQQVGGTSLPSYDPAASNAKEQGRALVQAASDALATDADGSLAAWLATHVTTAGANAAHQVVVNGPAVPVPDGWYLLQSEGKRPLLAWVAGGDVELGDKSDTPTLVKEIKDGDEWLDSGIYGNGQALEYRLILTVPETIKQFANGGTYTCAFHDEWDARLTLVPSSAKLTLVSSANGTRTDITELMTLQAKDSSFTATIDNLCDAAVQPGDTVELTYSMIVDPNAAAGSAGLINTAWATFPLARRHRRDPQGPNEGLRLQGAGEKGLPRWRGPAGRRVRRARRGGFMAAGRRQLRRRGHARYVRIGRPGFDRQHPAALHRRLRPGGA